MHDDLGHAKSRCLGARAPESLAGGCGERGLFLPKDLGGI